MDDKLKPKREHRKMRGKEVCYSWGSGKYKSFLERGEGQREPTNAELSEFRGYRGIRKQKG